MNNVTNFDGIALLSELKKFIDKVFKKKMETVVQIATATVISVDGSGNVTVRLLNSGSDGSQDFVAANQCGATLVANDVVTLFYWGSYSTARIFVKN